MKILLLVLIGLVFVSLCAQQSTQDVQQQAIDACIEECENIELEEIDIGPCLFDPIPELPDWVCDIAHDPRQDVDNLPENQCSAYRDERAKHFVEVDTNCNLIRAI